MKILFRFIVLLLVLSACSASENQSDINSPVPVEIAEEAKTLVPVDTLSFELDSLTSAKSWIFQFKLLNNKPYFIIANQAINSLQAYNLLSEKLEKRIFFPKEGPNKISIYENFYVHNWDSLFFLEANTNNVLLYDSTAQTINKWSLQFKEEHQGYTATTQEYYFRPSYEEKTSSFGFWVYPSKSAFSSEFYTYAKAFDYNLSEGTYKVYGQYPPNYFNEKGTYIVHRPTNGYTTENHTILHYTASSLIYLYDKNSKELLKVIDAKSKYLPDGVPPLMTQEPENKALLEERIEYYLTTGNYEYMFSNEDYSYHYRIVKHPGAFKDDSGKQKTNDEFTFSIMIFDKDFRLLNELAFSPSIYDYRQSFAYQDKLYLCMNNPKNTSIGEDDLMFQVLQLIEAKE